ncbi:MAG: hypothetical protein WAU42_04605 [Solirubrobacteraceae bacterium]
MAGKNPRPTAAEAAIDPARAIKGTPAPVEADPDGTSLAAGTPLLLLPIRIETRFVSLVPSPSIVALGRAAEAREGKEDAGELLVRVYPDTISTSSFEAELTTEEIAAGSAYWQLLWEVGDPPASADSAEAPWRVLAAAYGSPRAAWIALTMTPTNIAERPSTAEQAASAPAPSFPSPPTRASSYEQTPTTQALPDSWVVVLESDGNSRNVRGTPITAALAVGLTPHDGVFPEGQPVDAAMRWLVDFGEAEAVGMGIRIPLTAVEARGGFDRVLVFGVRDGASDGPGEEALRQLLDDHHYTDGVAFVPQGAPTNNTSDASSAFTTSDPNHSISFAVELGPDLAGDASSDGPLLANALGLAAETFAHVRDADGHGARNARDMLTALWPATLGYFVDQMMDPLLDGEEQDAMREFVLECVLPRGPLPAVRVGQTPYGVLPTTSLSVLGEDRSARDVADRAHRPRSVLAALVSRLLPVWQASVAGVPHIGATGDPDQDLVQVLGMEASSVAFRGRRVVGDDTLWNLLTFLNPSGLTEEGWLEHLIRGKELLDSLGLSAWNPRVIHTSMGAGSYPVPYPTVQDAPLSETEPLAAEATLNGEPVNYIQWLRHAPMADVWAENYPGTKPTSILYRVLRQSILREYVTQAGRAQVAVGVLAASSLREVELVDIQPAAPTLTAREIVDRPVSAGSPLTWAQHLDALEDPPPGSPLARLAELRASMDRLASLPTAELDRTLTETLDAASHRLDVWITALSTSLLAEQRAQAGKSPAGAAEGDSQPALHLGAYGWVENLRPAEQRPAVSGEDAEAVTRLDRERERLTGGIPPQPVRLPSEDSGGFIQAPSMTQAAAGAVLRSGYMSHRNTPDEPALAIDLSSSRTRDALWILAGVRQGLSLGALTGFKFEQQLHEASLDVYVQPFRDAYPLVGDELHGASANGAVLPPAQVVDGVALRAAWQGGTLTPGESWGAGLPAAGSPDQSAVVAMLETIDDMLSALSDVSISESVFQIMRGNYGRSGGILDAVSQGQHPPDPEIVVTPRPGLDVTHRLMLLFAGPPPPVAAWSSVTVRPRALLEPWLTNWLAARLPDPATVSALVGWTEATAAAATATVTLRDLDIGPLDVLALADASQTPQRAELEDRILLAANPPSGATAVTITYSASALPSGSTTFPDLLVAARALRDLIGAARPLDLAAFALPDKTPTSGSVDLVELTDRVSALVAALQADTTALQNALTALQGEPSSEPDAAALAAVLHTASSYGVSSAIPAPASSAETLISQATAVLEQLHERQTAITASPSTQAELMANATAVLGASAALLVHQTPPDAASVQAAFAQSSAMQEVEPQALRRWLLQLSHVRPAAQRLDSAFAATRLLGAARPVVELAQLPLTANDRWLGLPLEAGKMPAGGRVSIEAVCVGDPSTATAYAGLLVDEWLDRIPAATSTSGVSFHYEEPTSRAPQAMLLALCPDARQTWDLGLVQTILDETFELAKCRAVDLASIREVGQILPALYFPFNLQAATPATHFMEVAEVAKVNDASH